MFRKGSARAFGWVVAAALCAAAATAATAGAAIPNPDEQAPPAPPPHKGAVDLANGDLRETVLAGPSEPLPEGVQYAGGEAIVVEVLFRNGDGGETREAIADVEGEVTGSVTGELIQAEVPIDELVGLEADPAVTYVRPPLEYDEPVEPDEAELDALSPGTAGSFAGEQIQKTNAGAWHAEGITGQGVKVGIIDAFSSSHYSAAVASGEIPAVSGTFCLDIGVPCGIFSGERHGIAVSEAVADMAPSAQLYYADVTSASDTQAALNYFASQGVDVVTRSQTGRYDGPGNGTGTIASVIESSAVGQGMFYLNSAGNSAGRSGFSGSYWRGGFVDTDIDGFLEFAPGVEFMEWDCSFQNGLRWNDFGEGSQTTDYDLYVYNSSLVLTDSSEVAQGGGFAAPPLELATGCTTDPSYIRIQRFATNGGDTNDTLEFMVNGSYVEYDSNPFSATGPMADLNSAGAVSVGAVDPALGTTIAGYSSEGPTNDGRIKPDLSAAACVQSLTYAPGCFNGTSSSTPVTAGAAALALSGGAADSPQSLKSFLLSRTVDRGAGGPDNVYGQGELYLGEPPDILAPTVTALKSRGKSGKRVSLRYTVSDDSGLSEETVTVSRKGKVLKTLTSELGEATGGTYAVTWRVPRRIKGRMSFCIASADPSGNTSSESCAKLRIKKKKRRKR